MVEVNAFKVLTGSLSERRNRVVHDPWSYGYHSKKHYRLQVTARAKLELEYRHVPTEDVEKITEEIGKAEARFSEVRSQILDAYYASPHKPL